MHWMLLHPKLQPQAGSELPYMISDPQLNGLVYYDTFTRETLVLSRGQWYRVHSKVNPGIWFGGPAIAYDPMRKYLLLFGVKDRTVKGRVIRESQTWILSANGWRRIRTATSPPPLSGSSLGCDPVTGQCVLFGGIEPALSSAKRLRSVRFFTETWIWNGSTWKRIYTPHHPSAQLNAPVAWDSYTHQLVLFGGFQDKARRESMAILALITAIGTFPKPSVGLLLNGLQEVLANNFRRGLDTFAMSPLYDLLKLALIPILHSVLISTFYAVVLLISSILIKINLGGLSLHSQVMRELALVALGTGPVLEKVADYSLWVHARWHFLLLHYGLEKGRDFRLILFF